MIIEDKSAADSIDLAKEFWEGNRVEKYKIGTKFDFLSICGVIPATDKHGISHLYQYNSKAHDSSIKAGSTLEEIKASVIAWINVQEWVELKTNSTIIMKKTKAHEDMDAAAAEESE